MPRPIDVAVSLGPLAHGWVQRTSHHITVFVASATRVRGDSFRWPGFRVLGYTRPRKRVRKGTGRAWLTGLDWTTLLFAEAANAVGVGSNSVDDTAGELREQSRVDVLWSRSICMCRRLSMGSLYIGGRKCSPPQRKSPNKNDLYC